MKRVLVLSVSDLGRDARVSRQVAALAGRADVTVAALAPGADAANFIHWPGRDLAAPLAVLRGLAKLAGLHRLAYWISPAHRALLRRLRGERFDVVVANDAETLPVAMAIDVARRVFDAHEYAPRQFEHDWKWRLVSGRHADGLLRRYAGRADAMFTVSSGLAAEYRREYGLVAEVMPNAAPFHALSPSPLLPGRIRLVHHGWASPVRHIEDMLEAMRYLDGRFSLDLYLVPGPDDYMRRLRTMADADSRIRLLPPVPMRDLIATINRYDVGLGYFRPATFNLANTLPNKFFEYVQARLAIATGPTPDMAELVIRYGIGVVAPEFSPAALAAALSALDASSLQAMKQACDPAASELSFEKYASRFREVVLDGAAAGERLA